LPNAEVSSKMMKKSAPDVGTAGAGRWWCAAGAGVSSVARRRASSSSVIEPSTLYFMMSAMANHAQ